MDKFELKYRFTEEEVKLLPLEDLSKIHPLNKLGEAIVYQKIYDLKIRKGYQLNPEYFSSIIQLNMKSVSGKEIMTWLNDHKIDANRKILLVWDSWGTVITEWHIFKKYYEDFFFPVSDDLTIIDKSLSWALYIFHEEIMSFGRNDDIILSRPKKLM